jgi:hypothetical protein
VIGTLRVSRNKRSFWRKFLLWIGFLKKRPLPKSESDLFLKQVTNFNEWIEHIKKIDSGAYQELIDLGKEPRRRERR